jgi:hypothetical protein
MAIFLVELNEVEFTDADTPQCSDEYVDQVQREASQWAICVEGDADRPSCRSDNLPKTLMTSR